QSSFFFQAEDGIRDRNVTGVQTCALPIFALGSLLGALTRMRLSRAMFISACVGVVPGGLLALDNLFSGHHSPSADMTNEGAFLRSEERRVGKECESWRRPVH